MKNKKSKTRSIELLNFEGPVLVAHRYKNIFFITDEFQKLVKSFTKKEFLSFIEGKISVHDSSKRKWNYLEQHSDAKPNVNHLYDFINLPKSKDKAKNLLIELLEGQLIQLTLMSKIELGDEVIEEIKRLKLIINE
jgi:hypothetical protein